MSQLDSRPILNAFEANRLTDSNIKSYEIMRYIADNRPNTTSANNSEFVINARNAGLDSFILPERAYVEVEYKLFISSANDAHADDKHQTLESGWHLFQQAAVGFGSQDIEFVQECGALAHMKHLVYSSAEFIEKQGPQRKYYPQSSDLAITAMANANPTTAPGFTPALAEKQLARAARAHQTAATVHRVKLPLRDVFGFCSIDKAYPGVDLKLRLTTEQNPKKYLFRGAGSTAGFARISNVELYLPVVRPSNSLMLEIGKPMVEGKKIPVAFEHWNYQSVNIADGATSVNSIISTTAKRPTAVFIGMQTEARYDSLATNKLNFDLLSLTQHSLLVDGKQYPLQGYQGSLDKYQMEYETYLQMSGKQTSDHVGPWLDYDQYLAGLGPLCYDLSASRDETGTVRNNSAIIQWKAALTATDDALAHVFVVDNQYREIEIRNGQVIITAPDYVA